MKTGIELIAEERQRQIEKEGWTLQHDDGHDKGELAMAAMCYLIDPNAGDKDYFIRRFWPFDEEYYKPTPNNRIRELVKSASLILADIERIQRIKS